MSPETASKEGPKAVPWALAGSLKTGPKAGVKAYPKAGLGFSVPMGSLSFPGLFGFPMEPQQTGLVKIASNPSDGFGPSREPAPRRKKKNQSPESSPRSRFCASLFTHWVNREAQTALRRAVKICGLESENRDFMVRGYLTLRQGGMP